MDSAGGTRGSWRGAGAMAALAALVGVLTGAAAIAFEYLCQFVAEGALGGLGGYRPEGPAGEPVLFSAEGASRIVPWMLVALPAAGCMISAWLTRRVAPEAGGSGTDAAIDAFHRHEGRVRGRVPFLKGVTTAITVGAGGSAGREGPIAQIGAGLGSMVGGLLRLTTRQRRILLAAGMGAGVGAIFRAPLAGAIFPAEILYREAELESDVVLPSFISVSVAYCTFCAWFGEFGSLFSIPASLAFEEVHHLLAYTLLALTLAAAIFAFVKTYEGTKRLARRLGGPHAGVAALGGGLAGLLGLGAWALLDDDRALAVLAAGYGVLQSAFEGDIFGWAGVRLLAIVAVGKILTTALTIGPGGSGGLFGPSMVIGGALGGAVGIGCHELGFFGEDSSFHVASFVVVGMCGFFAGAAKTPISTIIMVCDMTGSYQLLLPAMWVCAITFVLCRPVTIYSTQVATRAHSPAHRDLFRIPLLQDMRVSEVLETDRPFPTLKPSTPLGEVVRIVADTHADYFPVVDDDGRFVGIFSAHDVRSFTYDDTLHALAAAADLMVTEPITVTPDDDLHLALERFQIRNIDELPVVDPKDPTRLVGMLRRRALSRAYRDRLAGVEDERRAGL